MLSLQSTSISSVCKGTRTLFDREISSRHLIWSWAKQGFQMWTRWWITPNPVAVNCLWGGWGYIPTSATVWLWWMMATSLCIWGHSLLYMKGVCEKNRDDCIPTSQKSRTNRLMSTKQKIPDYKKQQKPVVAVVIVVLQEFVSSLMRGVRLFNICVIILTLCR